MPVEKPGPEITHYCKTCHEYVSGPELGLHRGKCMLVPVDRKKATMATPSSEIADNLMYDKYFITLRDTDEIYMWDGKVWIENGETWIKEIVQLMLHNVETHFVNEVVNQVRRRTYMERERFQPPLNLINVENGIINTKTGEFRPHDRMCYFRNVMPVTYDPHARCPRILQFLTQCLGTREIITVIEEMASTFVPGKLERAYMWIGKGANGKSTLMRVFQTFLGSSSYSTIPIHDLLRDRFARSELEGKMANIFPDISSNEIRHTHVFKGLTSGDEVRADRKNRGSIKLRNRAKFFFSCNELPQLDEDTDAIHRRWIMTSWLVQFDEKSRNIHLIDELTTQEEMSGLLNLLLSNSRKMQNRGDFSYPPTIDQMRKEWHERSDHVETFTRQALVQKADSSITNDRLYFLYNQYCKMNNIIAESDRTFLMKLRKLILMDTISTRKNGRAVRIQKGVAENIEWSKQKNIPLITTDGIIMEQFTEQPQQIPQTDSNLQGPVQQAVQQQTVQQPEQPNVIDVQPSEQRAVIQDQGQSQADDDRCKKCGTGRPYKVKTSSGHNKRFCNNPDCEDSYYRRFIV